MPTFFPEQLARWTNGHWTSLPPAPLTGFTCDTRQLRAGEVFVAIKTEQRDGHAFLAAARANGAGAALVATAEPTLNLPQLVVADPLHALQAIAAAHRRSFPGPVIGISGSAGKTSTKDLLALLLGGEASGVLATEGNLNNHLGVPLTLTRLDLLKHEFAVIEAGISAPGEMQLLAEMIAPDVAIITLVAPAHTHELGGIEGVAREKAVLPAAVRPEGVAIFPKSVGEFAPFRALGGRALVVERAEVLLPDVVRGDRAFFAVSHRETKTAVALSDGKMPTTRFVFRRVSDGMAQNAALAIVAALRLGVPRATIQSRLAEWKPAKLRGEVREINGRMFYLDCYNANPASMVDALAAFEQIAPAGERRLFVIGCMEELGVEAPAHHRALGRRLRLNPGDVVFVTGTQAQEVRAGLLETGDFAAQIQVVESLAPIAAFLADWRGSVFVKGSRRYQLEKILEAQTSLPLPC
ncbi:MAG: UDP-N-acetylmuramoyl-tripeptide--D-alanyl-D-alanine ligase [Opitutaceae bacterium]